MKRYIIADLSRLSKRVPRWILVGLGVLIPVIIGIVLCLTSDNPIPGSDFISTIKNAIGLCGTIFGLLEIEFIYGDDFKAKTMQIAIGSGISRRRIVNSKWVITMIVVAFDILTLTILMSIVGAIFSAGFSVVECVSVFMYSLAIWLSVISAVGVVAILIFAMQKIGLGVLLYLCIQFGVIGKIIEVASTLLEIERFHINSYELTSLNEVFAARMELGSIHMQSLAGVLIYMVISFFLACLVFKHRELEF